ncbi:MAG: transporter substrate-binding domain-containing protein [Desulfobacter sp.]|nr:MAG: transporter substrate-binding domain-containing protein [Desulfobacter sp.]
MLLLPAATRAGNRLVLATLDWEPYIGRQMKDQGFLAVIIRQAFQRSGVDVKIEFHQWSRVVGLAKKGRVDGYFPEYYAPRIKDYAEFSAPIPAGPVGFFSLKTAGIRYTRLEELKKYRIGIVKGYVNASEFDAADFLDKHGVKDDLSNLKLLLAGRVNLMVADKYVGFHLLKKHMPDRASEVEFLPTILEPKDIFVCISTKIKKTGYFLKAFNRGLAQMTADGTLGRLLPKFQ